LHFVGSELLRRNFLPEPVDYEIAVRLDDNHFVRIFDEVSEKCPERSLSLWMQVDFGLLKQEPAACRIENALDNYWERLADSVPNIDEICCSTCDGYKNLEWGPRLLPQVPNADVLEE